MKTLNKFIFLFLLSLISIGVFSGSIVSAQDTVSEPSIAVSEEDNTNDFTTFLEKATFVSTKLCMSILSILSC